MKNYELNCLISPNISTEEIQNLQEKIEKIIESKGGTFTGIKNLAKRNLPNFIKTRSHPRTDTIYLLTLIFNLEPEKIKEIEKNIKSENQILRYSFIIKKPIKPIKQRKISEARKPKRIKQEKAKLEEINEKLDEILGDI